MNKNIHLVIILIFVSFVTISATINYNSQTNESEKLNYRRQSNRLRQQREQRIQGLLQKIRQKKRDALIFKCTDLIKIVEINEERVKRCDRLLLGATFIAMYGLDPHSKETKRPVLAIAVVVPLMIFRVHFDNQVQHNCQLLEQNYQLLKKHLEKYE